MRASASHLPPGHEPGPQSLRAKRGTPVAMILFGLFALGFLAGAIALFATRNGGGSRSGKETGAIVFVAVALVFVALMWWTYRRATGSGPQISRVTVEPDRVELRRGEKINVNVRCDSAPAQGQFEVGLLCTQFEDVKRQTVDQNGYTHDVRVISKSNVVEQWCPVTSQAQSFTFELPAEAPFSYEGATVSWAYLVSVKEPRSMRSDPHHDVPIWVSP